LNHPSGANLSARRRSFPPPQRQGASPIGSTFQTARNAGLLKTFRQFREFVGGGDTFDSYKSKWPPARWCISI
jgi:hypothetical protein